MNESSASAEVVLGANRCRACLGSRMIDFLDEYPRAGVVAPKRTLVTRP